MVPGWVPPYVCQDDCPDAALRERTQNGRKNVTSRPKDWVGSARGGSRGRLAHGKCCAFPHCVTPAPLPTAPHTPPPPAASAQWASPPSACLASARPARSTWSPAGMSPQGEFGGAVAGGGGLVAGGGGRNLRRDRGGPVPERGIGGHPPTSRERSNDQSWSRHPRLRRHPQH